MADCSSSHHSKNGQVTVGEEFELVLANSEMYEGVRYYFLPNTDGLVHVIDDFGLEGLYEWNYDSIFPTFEEFKKCALDGSINLNYQTIQDDSCAIYYGLGSFKIDSVVMMDYEKSSFRDFKDKYCETMFSILTSKDNRYALDNDDHQLTIAYCLWLKGYHYYSQGCLGEYYFRKAEKDTIFVMYDEKAYDTSFAESCRNPTECKDKYEASETVAISREQFDSICCFIESCQYIAYGNGYKTRIHIRLNDSEISLDDMDRIHYLDGKEREFFTRCFYLIKWKSGYYNYLGSQYLLWDPQILQYGVPKDRKYVKGNTRNGIKKIAIVRAWN